MSSAFGPGSKKLARLVKPAGMASHWSKRRPLPSEYEPATQGVHCWVLISKNIPAGQEKAGRKAKRSETET